MSDDSGGGGPVEAAVAAELRAQLARLNRSRRWLATQIGAPHVSVSRWLNTGRGLSLDRLDQMCAALGLVPSEVLRGVEQRFHRPGPGG